MHTCPEPFTFIFHSAHSRTIHNEDLAWIKRVGVQVNLLVEGVLVGFQFCEPGGKGRYGYLYLY